MLPETQHLIYAVATLGAALVAGLLLHSLIFRLLGVLFRKSSEAGQAHLLSLLKSPTRLAFVLLALLLVLPTVEVIPQSVQGALQHALGIGVIIGLAWFGTSFARVAMDLVMRRYDIEHQDNLDARRMQTQLVILRRTLSTLLVAIAVAAILMTFPRVREIGASLLVSAGVAGLAVGLAARPVLENLIAGLQLAFTQPIRVDDVVVIEGEWGRIEEITGTYVVVRIWDERRLIVPFSHIISQPFQNWTRRSAEILGYVYLYVDYSVPVEAVRQALDRLCAENPLWDGRVCNLQVTNSSERTLELRALVSAADSGKAWQLRVQLREQLIAFLQLEYPDALPRARLQIIANN